MDKPARELTPDPSADAKPDRAQTGEQAAEALAWAIAQEFVLAFDNFHNSVLEDDRPEQIKATTAAR